MCTIIILFFEGEDITYWSGSFSHDVSMPPTSLRFDHESDPSTSSLLLAALPPQSPHSPSPHSPVPHSPHSPVPKRRLSTGNYFEPPTGGGGGGGGGGRESQYRNSLYASLDGSDQSQVLDWESGSIRYSTSYHDEGSDAGQPLTLSSIMNQSDEPVSLMPRTSIPPSLYRDSFEEEEFYRGEREGGSDDIRSDDIFVPFDSPDLGGGDELMETDELYPLPAIREGSGGRGSKKLKRRSTHVNFASIPTNPRDWVVMDALQEEIKDWKPLGLYVIGEKSSLVNIPTDIYPNCTLLPVEV